jgi:bile acid:Na+ symporter, BASS family
MLAMGLQVAVAAVAASARAAGRVALGVTANYVLVPAVTVGLVQVFQPDPLVGVGFLILAGCPGAPVGPPAVTIARGDVPWAIGLMIILGALSAVLSPLLLGVMMPWMAADHGLDVDFLAIARTLLVAQLLPLAVGLAIHHYAPALTARLVRPVGAAANVLLLVLIGLIIVTEFDTLAAIRGRAWVGMAALFFASLAVGWACGTGGVAIRKASALTTAGRNAAVGLAIATGTMAGTPVVTAVVAYGLVSMLGTLGSAVLVGRFGSGRRNEPAADAPGGTAGRSGIA